LRQVRRKLQASLLLKLSRQLVENFEESRVLYLAFFGLSCVLRHGL